MGCLLSGLVVKPSNFFLHAFPIYVKSKLQVTVAKIKMVVSFMTNKCGGLKHPQRSILVLMNR